MRVDRLIRSGLTTELLRPASKLKLVRIVFDIVRANISGMLPCENLRAAAPLDTETACD